MYVERRNRAKKKRKVLSFSRDIDIHAFFYQYISIHANLKIVSAFNKVSINLSLLYRKPKRIKKIKKNKTQPR
jgi:hypothetical protein